MFPILAIKCDNRIIEGLIHNDTRSPISDPFYMKETFVYPNWLGSLTEIPQERLIYDVWHVSQLKLRKRVTSMLVTDVGGQMCCWQDFDGGDKSRHQHRELGTNIKYQSPTSHSGVLWCWWPIGMLPTCTKMSSTYFFCRQHLKMVTIIKSPTSLSSSSLVQITKGFTLTKTDRVENI